MLRARDLSFGFGGRALGAGLTFDLAAGEVLCLLGPNGSGKTTLLRTLLGLAAPLAGRVEREAVAGYVPQQQGDYFAFTVREMVAMGRARHVALFSAPSRADAEAVERALDALDIRPLAERPITELSSGERQLALLARALAQDPGVLIMDEPTASLDFGNQARVLEHAAALAARGLAVVFSSHDPGHAFAYAHRVLLLDTRGLAVGRVADLLSEEALERLYGVPMRVVELGDGRRACLPGRRAVT
jgi:iron complex transport system ATP-binding protein